MDALSHGCSAEFDLWAYLTLALGLMPIALLFFCERHGLPS